MLICLFPELVRKSCTFFAALLLIFQGATEAEGTLERKAAAVGSSVLLPAPDNVKGMTFLQWEYLNGTTSHFIVQYHKGSPDPTAHAPSGGRVIFYPANGSLLLENVQETDNGIYAATINMVESEARRILLQVLKPVSRPQLWSNSLLVQSAIKLFCDVSEGRVDTIVWKKDGKHLPQERDFHLSKNLSILNIPEGQKSDCGSYSCNVSNEISWQESSLNLTIAGISPALQDSLRISVVALVFAAVSGWGLIVPFCQPEKLRIRGQLWRWLSAYIHGLVCVSSILASAAALLWMREEGPSAAFVLPEILLTYVILVTCLLTAVITVRPQKLNGFTSKASHRTLDFAAPGGVILVVLIAVLLIKKIHQLQEKDCTESVDLTATVSMAVASLLPLLAIFACYHINQTWQREGQDPRGQIMQVSLEHTSACPLQ
ncbi:CD276 antigen-like [Mauremys mutica]|uniref:CD276 antigen-like n=1 Tax=Mauremys mutica TaxID=74926 RepID=UPI001D16C427|nr:CD276 antigen-like [Mauremys mutica]